MATSTSPILTNNKNVTSATQANSDRPNRRSIDPQSGRALLILGHAIDYLTDELIYAGGSFTENRGQVDAIQLMMALNRKIYLACPEIPRFGQWLRQLLRRRQK